MAIWYKKGTVIHKAISIGPWVELIATINGVDYRLGTVKDGHLIIESRLHKHRGTNKVLDAQIPSAIAVEFRGIMEEVNRENLLMILNRSPTEEKVTLE